MVCCSNIQILWFWLSTKHEYHEFGFEVNKVFSLGQAIDYRSSIQSGSLKSTSAQPQWFFRVAPFTLLDIYRTNTLSPLRLELDKIVLYPRGVSFCYGHKSIETAIQLCWNQQRRSGFRLHTTAYASEKILEHLGTTEPSWIGVSNLVTPQEPKNMEEQWD